MRLAITFCRMNPPTIGHERLVQYLKKVPAHERRIYLSSSHDSKNNPLDFQTRYEYAKKAFEDMDAVVSAIPQANFFDALRFAGQLGFSELAVVIGSDRYPELSKRIPRYNGSEYNFTNIRVLSAGDRDDTDTETGMSASKMRAAALRSDFSYFESGLPKKLKPMAADIFTKVREECLSKALATS